MRKLLLLTLLTLSLTATAQQIEEVEQQMPELEANEIYIVGARDFAFPFSRLRHRGLDARYNPLIINTLPLNSPLSPTPWAALGHATSIAIERSDSLILVPFEFQSGGRASTGISNRTYSYKAMATYNLTLKNGWGVALSAARRWGRSLSIEGIFADNTSIYFGAQKRWTNGSTLALTAIFAPTTRAYASPSTLEAFALANNNLYNPAWGQYGNRQRSTNVRATFEPIIMINHSAALSPKLTIASAAMVRFGQNSRTALNWQGAPNPNPDYYKYLPSAQSDPVVAEQISHLWQTSQSARQINFNTLQNTNANANGRANYIVENRVNRPLDIVASTTLAGSNFNVGATFRYERTQSYKTISDLLSGAYWLDIDSFVEQDEDIKLKTQNNLRDPNRHVVVGDVFGYNYALSSMFGQLHGAYQIDLGRWRLHANANASLLTLQRQGFYEKENFPSGNSYGASRAAVFGQANVEIGATYRLGSRFDIAITAAAASQAPTANSIFPDARYRNFINPDICNENSLTLAITANYRTDKIKAHVGLHHISITDGITTRQMYDDIASQYIIYAMRGVNRRFMGLQASAEIKLYDALSLNTAIFLQNNIYTSNPIATAYNQNSGDVIRADESVDFTGLRTPFSPQTAFVIELSYRPYNWVIELSSSITDNNYVDPSPLRRTAAQRQHLNTVTTQEKLPFAISLDIFGGYNFRFHTSSLGIYGSINNILCNSNIISTGYESNRISRISTGYQSQYAPQSSKYYYALPINFSLNVTYRF